MTPPNDPRAWAAAKELFTDGRKLHADRLVMEFRGGTIDGTGWCEGAVRDIIAKHFEGDALRTAAERLIQFYDAFDHDAENKQSPEGRKLITALRDALKTKE